MVMVDTPDFSHAVNQKQYIYSINQSNLLHVQNHKTTSDYDIYFQATRIKEKKKGRQFVPNPHAKWNQENSLGMAKIGIETDLNKTICLIDSKVTHSRSL